MPVIMKVRNAKKEYQVGDSTVHAVDGVSFSVNKGIMPVLLSFQFPVFPKAS